MSVFCACVSWGMGRCSSAFRMGEVRAMSLRAVEGLYVYLPPPTLGPPSS